MFLGFDWEFLEGRNGVLSYLSMCFAFLIGILLLNILIAAISDGYAGIKESSLAVFWVNRVAYIIEVESIVPFLKKVVCEKEKEPSSMKCILKKVPLLPGALMLDVWWNQISKKEREEFFDWWWD